MYWYHKGSIVYTALIADAALTPYYPTAEESHAANIWLMLNAAKISFDLGDTHYMKVTILYMLLCFDPHFF